MPRAADPAAMRALDDLTNRRGRHAGERRYVSHSEWAFYGPDTIDDAFRLAFGWFDEQHGRGTWAVQSVHILPDPANPMRIIVTVIALVEHGRDHAP